MGSHVEGERISRERSYPPLAYILSVHIYIGQGNTYLHLRIVNVKESPRKKSAPSSFPTNGQRGQIGRYPVFHIEFHIIQQDDDHFRRGRQIGRGLDGEPHICWQNLPYLGSDRVVRAFLIHQCHFLGN